MRTLRSLGDIGRDPYPALMYGPYGAAMAITKRWIIWGAVGLAAVLAVGGGVAVATTSSQVEPAAVPVTAKAEQATISSSVTGKGSIAPANLASAGFVDGGRVTSISVAVGQNVAAGQELATVDTGPADLALEKARSALSAAQSTLDTARQSLQGGIDALTAAKATLSTLAPDAPERQSTEATIRELTAQGPTQRDAVTQAERTRDDAQRDVAAAQQTRDQTTLLAPIAGVVVAVNGTVGTITSGGQSGQVKGEGANPAATAASAGLVAIADVSSLLVTAAIPEADITSVAVGQAVSVTLPAKGAEAIVGTVVTVAPTPQTSTDNVVSYPVVVQLTSVPAGVRLGQTAVVTITTATAENATVVPAEAVTRSSPTAGTVEVPAKSGKTKTVEVTIGISTPTQVQILDGLEPGDTVRLVAPAVGQTSGDGTDGVAPAGDDGSFGGPQ